jgi:hypothetical protein
MRIDLSVSARRLLQELLNVSEAGKRIKFLNPICAKIHFFGFLVSLYICRALYTSFQKPENIEVDPMNGDMRASNRVSGIAFANIFAMWFW